MKNFKKIICICFALFFLIGAGYAQNTVKVYVNGMRVNEDTVLINDRTYIPLRAVSEAMGAEVTWDGESQSAFVSFKEDDAIAKAIEDVSPSVVTIVGNSKSTSLSGQYNNPTMHGTGVIYKSNGHIITNAHVVDGIKNLTVVMYDGTTLAGSVLYSDEKADLAIVKVEKLGLKPITMASFDSVVSGKTAIAVGTPISLSLRNTVTKGIVSGKDVSLSDSYYKLIQTDATVNPGNSGGPLINIKGELIGINSSKYAGVGIDNMAFAIPVDTVEYVISQFEQYGKILRPALNFTLEQSWEASVGLPTSKGLDVKSSENSSLLAGDIITSVNGIPVHSISDWNEALKDTYDGNPISVTYTRDGAESSTELYV